MRLLACVRAGVDAGAPNSSPPRVQAKPASVKAGAKASKGGQVNAGQRNIMAFFGKK